MNSFQSVDMPPLSASDSETESSTPGHSCSDERVE